MLLKPEHPAERVSWNDAVALGGGIKPSRADCARTESWPHPLFSPSVLLWFPPSPIIPKQKAKSMKDRNAILTGQRAGSQRFTERICRGQGKEPARCR